MPLAANALTLLATLKGELGTVSAADAVLERIINAASDVIEQYVGRKLYRSTIVDERVKGHGGPRIFLDRTPVVSISAITYDSETVDATSYYVENADAGLVYRRVGWVWTALYRPNEAAPGQQVGSEEGLFLVDYVGGWITPHQETAAGGSVGARNLPYDIEQVCLDTCVQMVRNRGKYSNLQTETEMQEDATWRGNMIPTPAQRHLKRYRRIA